MLKQILRAQAVLTLFLIAVNIFVIISVKNNLVDFENPTLPPAPEGMVYMEYCDGGTSSVLVEKGSEGCIAEYPGDFAKVATAIYSVLLFILFSILYSIGILIQTFFFKKTQKNT